LAHLVYNLADSVLIDPEADGPAFMVWQPAGTFIVLGTSNQAEDAVFTDIALADGVSVYKRPSGGQTVILTPRTLVISIRFFSEKLENPKVYFRKINQIIIRALEDLGITDLGEKGISDIAIGEKKILGSSIYRKKAMVLYHAVLNVSESPAFISRYLKHPTREPDYRAGRNHDEFVTSIHSAGFPIEPEIIKRSLAKSIGENL
jgi:lipoate-protein ligase A